MALFPAFHVTKTDVPRAHDRRRTTYVLSLLTRTRLLEGIYLVSTSLPLLVCPPKRSLTARYARHANGDNAPPMDEHISNSLGGQRPNKANGITTIAKAAIEFAIACASK